MSLQAEFSEAVLQLVESLRPEGFEFLTILSLAEMKEHPEYLDQRYYRVLAQTGMSESTNYFVVYERTLTDLEKLERTALRIYGGITNFLR